MICTHIRKEIQSITSFQRGFTVNISTLNKMVIKSGKSAKSLKTVATILAETDETTIKPFWKRLTLVIF